MATATWTFDIAGFSNLSLSIDAAAMGDFESTNGCSQPPCSDDRFIITVSIDGGATWIAAEFDPPRNRYDWVRWDAMIPFPTDGYYEIVARATTASGKAQPFVANNWNPGGYACNAMHRIAILIG